MPEGWDDRQIRFYAFQEAKRLEGEKALTEDVLQAATWIYEFLTAAEIPAAGRTVH
jgi:hypothetical protein